MGSYVNEQDEYLLSQLLDGQLTETEATSLRARMEREPALARSFAELSRLDASMRARRADQPAVDYDAFHARLMAQVDVISAPVSEQDEFLLSRMLDRDLTGEEESALLRRLAAEPALKMSYRSLAEVNDALAARRGDVPDVDYDGFHERVMEQVEAETGEAARVVRFPAWARVAAPLAAAAAIVLAVWFQPGSVPTSVTPPGVGPVAQRDVTPPVVEETTAVDPTVLANAAPSTSVEIVRTTLAAARYPDVVVVNLTGDSTGLGRGRAADAGDASAIKVSFARSTDLANATQKVDDERARQPSRKVFFAAAAPARTAPANLAGEMF